MFDIVSDFVLVASFFRGVKRRKQLERPCKDVWVGGVALIRFPGGFGLLEIVQPGKIFWPCVSCFFICFLYLDFYNILPIS